MIVKIQGLNIDDKKRVYVEVDAQPATIGYKVTDINGNVLLNIFVIREQMESALRVTRVDGMKIPDQPTSNIRFVPCENDDKTGVHADILNVGARSLKLQQEWIIKDGTDHEWRDVPFLLRPQDVVRAMQDVPGQKGLNEPVHVRQLTHDFLKLPHHERINIMVEYGYLKTPDISRGIKDEELNKAFFTYVAESGRALDLQKTIDLIMTERKTK